MMEYKILVIDCYLRLRSSKILNREINIEHNTFKYCKLRIPTFLKLQSNTRNYYYDLIFV